MEIFDSLFDFMNIGPGDDENTEDNSETGLFSELESNSGMEGAWHGGPLEDTDEDITDPGEEGILSPDEMMDGTSTEQGEVWSDGEILLPDEIEEEDTQPGRESDWDDGGTLSPDEIEEEEEQGAPDDPENYDDELDPDDLLIPFFPEGEEDSDGDEEDGEEPRLRGLAACNWKCLRSYCWPSSIVGGKLTGTSNPNPANDAVGHD